MIKLLLMSKQKTRKDGKSKYRTFFTYVDIEVKGEEEKGLQTKSITVKFDKKVDTSKFFRGILTVEDKDIDIPYRYEIKDKVVDGETKKSYPHIFVRAVKDFEERKPKTTAVPNLMDEAEEVESTEIDEEDEEENE